MYQLRPYQQEASDRAIDLLVHRPRPTYAGLMVLGTGTGKSVIIADIARRLDGHVLVLQPSKEILEQNYAKLLSCGVRDASIYSASCGKRQISRITFATIGSIHKRVEEFRHFKYCIIDECDVVNPQDGMYRRFLVAIQPRTIGLTATPYRLHATLDRHGNPTSELRFITRTRPRFFGEVVYYTQQQEMARLGYLSPMRYFAIDTIDTSRLVANSTGQNYTDYSVRREFKRSDFYARLANIVYRLLYNAETPRNGILVFTQFIEEAQRLKSTFQGIAEIVTGDTPRAEREEILARFKAGDIRVVANVNCLSVGFDYPELDTVVLARPTMSLRLYYQQVGRAIRPHKDKPEAWVVDLVGTTRRFGRVEDLNLRDTTGNGAWVVESCGRQLTGIAMN